MQPVALFTLEVTAVQVLVLLVVLDGGLDGLAPLEQLVFFGIELLALAPVLDRDAGVVCVDAPVAQVDILSFRKELSHSGVQALVSICSPTLYSPSVPTLSCS